MDYNKLVQQQTEGMSYGQVQLTIKVHRGEQSKADTVRSTNFKIDSNNPEADAAAVMISAMKQHQVHHVGESTLGFVVMYRGGKPSVVQVQKFISQGVNA